MAKVQAILSENNESSYEYNLEIVGVLKKQDIQYFVDLKIWRLG